MNKKTILLCLSIALVGCNSSDKSQSPMEASSPSKSVTASAPKVISSIPSYTTKQITKNVTKQVCGNVTEQVQVKNTDKKYAIGATAGAVAGGTGGWFAGQSVGGPIGGAVGALVGAVGGAFGGGAIQEATQPSTVSQNVTSNKCYAVTQPKTFNKRIVLGYNVTYRYDGTTGTVFLKHKPGKHLSLSQIGLDDSNDDSDSSSNQG